MSVCVVSVGDELLRGNTVDTNSAWLAARLLEMGYITGGFTCLPDDRSTIARNLKHMANEFSVILVSGGLGPTNDDVTRDAAAEAFFAPLELKPELVDEIRRRFVDRGLDMPARNRKQAEIPRGAEVMPNPLGTAAGFHFQRGDKAIYFMPGVPREMKRMFTDHVAPRLMAMAGGSGERQAVAVRTLRVSGIGESALEEILADISDPAANPSVGFSCSPGLIAVHIVSRASDEARAEAGASDVEATIRAKVGANVVGRSGEWPADAVARVAYERKLTLVVVDMATGGRLVAALTEALGDERRAVLAAAEVLPTDEGLRAWGDELRSRAREALLEWAADVALVVGHRPGDDGAGLALASARSTKMTEVNHLSSRPDAVDRMTQQALAETWAFIEADGSL